MPAHLLKEQIIYHLFSFQVIFLLGSLEKSFYTSFCWNLWIITSVKICAYSFCPKTLSFWDWEQRYSDVYELSMVHYGLPQSWTAFRVLVISGFICVSLLTSERTAGSKWHKWHCLFSENPECLILNDWRVQWGGFLVCDQRSLHLPSGFFPVT